MSITSYAGFYHEYCENDKARLLSGLKARQKNVFQNACDNLKNDKKIVLKALRADNRNWKYVNKKFKDDEKFMSLFLGYSGYLQYASSRLKKDKEFVLAFIKQHGINLKYVDKRLRDDKNVVLLAIKKSGYILEYASDKLKKDKEVVLLAIKDYPKALKYVDVQLQDNNNIVISAIVKDGNALEYASARLQDDKNIVITAMHQKTQSFRFASNRLKRDKTLALLALKDSYSSARRYIDQNLFEDKDFVLNVIDINPQVIKYASKSLRADEIVIKKVLEKNPMLIHYASKQLRYKYRFVGHNKRKFKPEIWVSYNIDDIFEEIYGQKVILKEISKKVHIDISSYVIYDVPIELSIRSDIDIKSIVILEEESSKYPLMAYFPIVGEKFDTQLQFRYRRGMYNSRMKILVVIESKDGTYYKYEQKISSNGCNMDEAYAEEIEKNEKNIQNILAKYSPHYIEKMKIIRDDDNAKIYFSLIQPQTSYEEAQKKGIKPNFISHIYVKSGNKKIFEAYLSDYFPQKLQFEVKIKDSALIARENVDFTFENIQGQTFIKHVKIK